MDYAVVVRGRLTGRVIELDEPAGGLEGVVEVIVRSVSPHAAARPGLLEVIDSFPDGSLEKNEVDERMAVERGEWDAREGRLSRRAHSP